MGSMDDILAGRHPERSDDGKPYWHEGYAERKCELCGRTFTLALSMVGIITRCGYPDCGKQDKPVMA